MANQQQGQPKWVKLHMVVECQTMPETVTGVLMMETADQYVIGAMIILVRTPRGVQESFSEGINLISKKFVWRMENLLHKPELNSDEEEDLDDMDGIGGM